MTLISEALITIPDVVPLQRFNRIVLTLVDSTLLQILTSLADVWHVPCKSGKYGCIEYQSSTVCDIWDDIHSHCRGPLTWIGDRHHSILEYPTDNSQDQQEPSSEWSVVCGTPQPDKNHGHYSEAKTIGNQNHRRNWSSAPSPGNNARWWFGARFARICPWLPASSLESPLESRQRLVSARLSVDQVSWVSYSAWLYDPGPTPLSPKITEQSQLVETFKTLEFTCGLTVIIEVVGPQLSPRCRRLFIWNIIGTKKPVILLLRLMRLLLWYFHWDTRTKTRICLAAVRVIVNTVIRSRHHAVWAWTWGLLAVEYNAGKGLR